MSQERVRRAVPFDLTEEEDHALQLADDLRERLQRERDAAARLRDYLYGVRDDTTRS